MSENQDSNLDKVKAWLLPVLAAMFGVMLNAQVGTAVSEMKETRQQMQQMITKSEVTNAQVGYLTERVKTLENQDKACTEARQSVGTRISSLEQRAALYDQFMQTHK